MFLVILILFLQVGKLSTGAIAISLPFSCVLGLLSSMTASTMGMLTNLLNRLRRWLKSCRVYCWDQDCIWVVKLLVWFVQNPNLLARNVLTSNIME